MGNHEILIRIFDGVLHSACYPRKPRGVRTALDASYRTRLSFCCARNGCRRRNTPPAQTRSVQVAPGKYVPKPVENTDPLPLFGQGQAAQIRDIITQNTPDNNTGVTYIQSRDQGAFGPAYGNQEALLRDGRSGLAQQGYLITLRQDDTTTSSVKLVLVVANCNQHLVLPPSNRLLLSKAVIRYSLLRKSAMPLSNLRAVKEVDLTAGYASWEPAKLALWMAIHANAARKGVLLGESWEVEEAIDKELEAWSNVIEKELNLIS
jgi:hypothetical protein